MALPIPRTSKRVVGMETPGWKAPALYPALSPAQFAGPAPSANCRLARLPKPTAWYKAGGGPFMSLARDVTTVGSATLLSRLLGFAREVLIAAVLGARALSDAYFS